MFWLSFCWPPKAYCRNCGEECDEYLRTRGEDGEVSIWENEELRQARDKLRKSENIFSSLIKRSCENRGDKKIEAQAKNAERIYKRNKHAFFELKARLEKTL